MIQVPGQVRIFYVNSEYFRAFQGSMSLGHESPPELFPAHEICLAGPFLLSHIPGKWLLLLPSSTPAHHPLMCSSSFPLLW